MPKRAEVILYAEGGEDQTFHVVVFPDPVVFPNGVDDPVTDVDEIQQIAILLFCQFDFHKGLPPVSNG